MQGCWCAGSRGWTRAGLNLSTSTSAWAAAGRIGKSLNIWRSCQPSVGRAGDGGLQSGWDASGRFLRSGNRVQPLENQAVGEECTTAIGKVKVEQWRVGSGCSLEIIYADRNSLGSFLGVRHSCVGSRKSCATLECSIPSSPEFFAEIVVGSPKARCGRSALRSWHWRARAHEHPPRRTSRATRQRVR